MRKERIEKYEDELSELERYKDLDYIYNGVK